MVLIYLCVHKYFNALTIFKYWGIVEQVFKIGIHKLNHAYNNRGKLTYKDAWAYA